MACYGKNGQIFCSICMVACNVGFQISYVVLFKTMMPFTINLLEGHYSIIDSDKDKDHSWYTNEYMWAAIFSFVIVFPASLPRTLKALRFTSFFSVMISFYIVFVIIFELFCNRYATPDISEAFSAAWTEPKITVGGFFNSLPLIIFSYMYQINIPMIYHELADKNPAKMNKVLVAGTGAASIAYCCAGIFGYVTFAANSQAKAIYDA